MKEIDGVRARLFSLALILVVVGCDRSDNEPVLASANADIFSCNTEEIVDPVIYEYQWQQIGQTIYGAPPPTQTENALGSAIGRFVEVSRDGRPVLSSIGSEIIRSYTLNEEGLIQSFPDINGRFSLRDDIFSLSGDGNTLLRAEFQPILPSGPGEALAVDVLVKSTKNEWESVKTVQGTTGENLASVATNATGKLIAISFGDSFSNGYIDSYRSLADGTWLQLKRITGQSQEGLGSKIVLSDDGHTMIARRSDGINIYKLAGEEWIYQSTTGSEDTFNNYAPDSEAYGPPFVWNVALSGDGNVVAVGYVSTFFRTTKDFTVRLFRINEDTVHQIGQELVASYRHDSFGHGLELNCDGSIVTIGADTKLMIHGTK